MLPAMQEFIDRMRGLCESTGDDAERFEKARPLLRTLLEDPELKERAETWPSRNEPEKGYYENLLFYEDPDYGFVLNALIKEPGEDTPIHDHGRMWTVYGVLKGGETVQPLQADFGRRRGRTRARNWSATTRSRRAISISCRRARSTPNTTGPHGPWASSCAAAMSAPTRRSGTTRRPANGSSASARSRFPTRSTEGKAYAPRRGQSRVAQRVPQCEICRSGARGRTPEPRLFRRGTKWRNSACG